MKAKFTIADLILEAQAFCAEESATPNPALFGVTDGKAVGTFIEHKFKACLQDKYEITLGNSANGIDLPEADILTDIKVTSIRQPQSSCPFKDARQKIFGLGYNLLVFVYDKLDDAATKTASLNFVSCMFVEKERTGDYMTTMRLGEMVKDGAIAADVAGFLNDWYFPETGEEVLSLAATIIQSPPKTGCFKGMREYEIISDTF